MPPKPKKEVPDGPKPKRVMTPEQLEKLAAAREKAKAVKDAMKSENDEHKIRILQAKMDAIKKTSKKKPDPPEPIPELKEKELQSRVQGHLQNRTRKLPTTPTKPAPSDAVLEPNL